ncbi:hypothetical protein PoB_003751300 [Plakobranchus ocellatus]|uniref:Uncharacterized protein n=1 Tax=Plakobranchus ocellatus TaxID=259542 RepID=A0AAV4AWW0_9GAST|nr:hypothetical protein PoB_003751300 [Plakobranchus ocellatus]
MSARAIKKYKDIEKWVGLPDGIRRAGFVGFPGPEQIHYQGFPAHNGREEDSKLWQGPQGNYDVPDAGSIINKGGEGGSVHPASTESQRIFRLRENNRGEKSNGELPVRREDVPIGEFTSRPHTSRLTRLTHSCQWNSVCAVGKPWKSNAGLAKRAVGGTVASESALRSAETFLSQVGAPPPTS